MASVLCSCAPELTLLTRLFRRSYSIGIVPDSWMSACIHPTPENGRTIRKKYRGHYHYRSESTILLQNILTFRLITLVNFWNEIFRRLVVCCSDPYINFRELLHDLEWNSGWPSWNLRQALWIGNQAMNRKNEVSIIAK